MLQNSTDLIGSSLPDLAAPARLAGRGQFVADVPMPDDTLHVAFLRSPVPAGRLAGVATGDAMALSGVRAVHLGAEMSGLGALSINPVLPLLRRPDFPILADTRVSHLGQPLAAILADTTSAALDGVEALDPEIDETEAGPLPAFATKQWRAGNTALGMAEADHCVEVTIRHPRLAPSPMEPRGMAAFWQDGRLTIWHSTQTPHRTRSELASILGIAPEDLRVIAPDVGGAFGMKGSLYPEEVFVAWAALTYQRPVRWIATRGEDLLSATHGRGLDLHGKLGLMADGTFMALEARIVAPAGPWLPNSGLIPAWNAARILPGGYDIPSVDIETSVVPDARGPVGIYRGAGRPEAACLMERLVAKAAEATGIDPINLRMANVHAPTAFPVRTATGNLLDSGDYPIALAQAASTANIDVLRETQRTARAEGRLFGIGIAFYLEPSGEGFETARVDWHADGTATIASGSSSQGQARETGYAQIAADLLDISPGDATVLHGDTGTCPAGIGAVASRGTAIGGSAVMVACERLRARRLRGEALPMVEDVRYENEGQAWGYGVYVVAAEVDAETGTPTIHSAICLDDAGRLVNPAFAEGQIRGGFAQGLGEALMEQVVYDADGQLLTGSLMDYALPRAGDVPPMVIHSTEHPSPFNALGVKGIGEAGTIGAPAAILNAVLDALAPTGVVHLDMPLTPFKIWTAMNAAKETAR